ncbi:MAG: polysaccharide biosynthesis tyrosine autokinase [Proteobacteria bacterium]|nr:polysaccharide biosynthesis tyrosine autokinase [Pseudomonadota bacterium]
MIPGAQKRKADFTDVVMYVAIATKHARLIILLMTLSLAAGLVFYIFSRPVYSSKSRIRYTAIGSATPDMDTTFKGDDARRFSDDKFLKEFEAEHIVARTVVRLSGLTNLVADFDTDKLTLRELRERIDKERKIKAKDAKDAKRRAKNGQPAPVAPDDETRPVGSMTTVDLPKKDTLKQARATWDSEHNIESMVFAYSPEWVRTFPPAMVEEFLKDRIEKAEYAYEATTNKYIPQIEEWETRWKKQIEEENRDNARVNPEQLKNELEQLRDVPKLLENYKKRLERWEYVNRKINEHPEYTELERLNFYFSIDYRDGGGFVEFDRESKQNLPQAQRPSNGTVVLPKQGGRASMDDWRELERTKFTLENKWTELSATYRPGHQKMKELAAQIAAVDRKLKDATMDSRGKFLIEGRWLQQEIRRLQEELPTIEKRQKEYEKYTRERMLADKSRIDYQARIAELKTEMEKLEVALNHQRVDLQFIGFSTVRDEIPVSPNRLKIVLMSLGIGLALSLGIPFLLEFMDQTVTNMEKMEETTNMRGLGLVPDFEDEIAEAYPLIFSDGVANPDFIENFRVIRTNLLSSAASSKFPQVVMVTSTSPKEGKTVVASNLAMSFAHMGEKTLIIDGNLRRGILHHLFGSRSSPGLSNVLVEKYDVEDACRPTTMENLHILPCGDQLEGDIEQLGSPHFIAIIDKLRKRYQRIIVDATPVLGLAETSVMQPAMDGVILVIWTGQTPTRAVRTAIDILNDNHANFYGFVLNRLDLMATMNRFHYYYYTNHYYNRYQTLTRAKDQNQPR